MPREFDTYNSGDENQCQFELDGLKFIELQRQAVVETGRCCDGDYYYVVASNCVENWSDVEISLDFINESNRLFLDFLDNVDETLGD